MNPTPYRRLVAMLVLGLYVTACLLPAACDGEGGQVFTGAETSFAVWLLLSDSWRLLSDRPESVRNVLSIGLLALANCLLVLGWLCLVCNQHDFAAVCGWLAVLAAAPAWLIGVPLLEGYYLWHLSMLVLAVTAMLLPWPSDGHKVRP